jgi:hypothetical protein
MGTSHSYRDKTSPPPRHPSSTNKRVNNTTPHQTIHTTNPCSGKNCQVWTWNPIGIPGHPPDSPATLLRATLVLGLDSHRGAPSVHQPVALSPGKSLQPGPGIPTGTPVLDRRSHQISLVGHWVSAWVPPGTPSVCQPALPFPLVKTLNLVLGSHRGTPSSVEGPATHPCRTLASAWIPPGTQFRCPTRPATLTTIRTHYSLGPQPHSTTLPPTNNNSNTPPLTPLRIRPIGALHGREASRI